ncbi:Trm112 family protein [Skermania piniformis]|uniref:Trm112 family protein n=1 Tax=Skermania pinensis TaxID=39122 RepID=UPI001FEA048F|nr:Trm112 family protein [Skermania piniformis]
MDETLLSILACPKDKGPLLLVRGIGIDPVDELFYNPRLRLAYPIEDGIPVLLVDDARSITDPAEHEDLLARAAR